jgi:tyrocidine synthetase-3
MELDSTAYNMPEFIPLELGSDLTKIEKTIKQLIKRHENFRTSFYMVKDEPVQRIHDEVEFEIEYYDASQVEDERSSVKRKSLEGTRGLAPLSIEPAARSPQPATALISSFIRPFELSKAPLLRVGLLKDGEGNQMLLVDMHHIISDGVSHEILVNDFMALFEDKALPPLRIQYKDFSQWQNIEKEKENLKRQEEYWLKEFEGEIPVLNMPTDYTRPAVQSFEGSALSFEIGMKETTSVKKLALKEGATMYMVLLAVFNILLSKLSSQEDIVIGTPTAGRRHADLEPIIGMFVNTLALRNYPRGEKTFNAFLADVKEKTLQAFENQEYQFEDLVEKAAAHRDTGRNPLFDVMFALQNFDANARGEGSRKSVPGQSEQQEQPVQQQDNQQKIFRIAKFDMSLTCVEQSESLYFTVEYCTKLFKKETIERFTQYFRKIVTSVLKGTGQEICEIDIMPGSEKRLLLYEYNDTGAEYPGDKTLHELFAEQVEKTPDRIAASEAGELRMLSYGKLNEKANQLATLLIEKGIKTGSIISIMGQRKIEIIIGILGILKAGGAYLPIEAENPFARIKFLIQDSRSEILLTQRHLVDKSKELFQILPAGNIISLDDETTYPVITIEFKSGPTPGSAFLAAPTDCAYVIYTSGTTGRPKGVMISHGSAVNYISWAARKYVKNESVNFTLYTAFSFDMTVTSIFTPLITGNALVIYGGDYSQLLVERIIEEQKVDILKLTPSHLKLIRDKEKQRSWKTRIKRIIVGGEELDTQLAKDISDKFAGNIEIYNEYGPTEATVGCMLYRFNPRTGGKSVPLGVPAANTKIYFLDQNKTPVPPGVVGEIHIGGKGIAIGYLNQPELTAEKFDHDLWDYHDYQDEKNYLLPGSDKDHTPSCHRAAVQPRSHASVHYPITPIPQSPIYRTGDLARWLPDGNIEFLGRLDHQVKIRGFRIELGEIENQLLKKEEIKEAVVLNRESENGDKYLYAYIVWKTTSLETAKLREYLSRSLPDYMIPSYFVEIEKTPLTTSGKIDRSALPIPQREETRESLLTPYTPKDVLEQKLMEIWAEILAIDIERIGATSNFFHLGGHSLKATIMTEKIQKELNVNMPLIEVFKTPTIKQLAEYIRTTETESFALQDNNLVLIRKGTEKDHHLFFVHDTTGEVDRFIKFCNYLKIGFNCWGLRADRLENYIPLNISLKDIAQKYIKKIKKVQPPGHGPYYIAGWSMGGLIAFEMARQLEKEKEKVAFLGLIDSKAPSQLLGIAGWFAPNKFNLHSELKFLKRLFVAEDRIEKRSKKIKKLENFWSEIGDYLETEGFDKQTIKRKILKFGRQILPNFQRLNVRQCIYYLNQGRTFTRAVKNYIPFGKIKNAPVHFFKANQSWQLKGKCWEKYTTAPVQLYDIPGDHFSIFLEHIAELVKSFNKAVNRL